MTGFGGSGHSKNRHNTLNPNATWIVNSGFVGWYFGVFWVVHLILLSIPVITTAWAWTATNLVHSLITFYLFHWLKGSPVSTIEDAASQTQWEQMINATADDEQGYDPWNRRFLQLWPLVPFFLSIHYSHHENFHFWLNVAAFLLCIIPKFPGIEGVRLFGLNRY